MRKLFSAIMRARQARADRAVLERLDGHTLRDIGLESWNSELAERLESRRQHRLLRRAATRIGMF
ncbi:MAG: hypothetical protein QOD26_935 [Betaproteobacteria bacterium]|jgi:hypothetical protein|nr:hypothetical protein [Betaproteobacteria bacterium]